MCGYDPFENYEYMLDKQYLDDLDESEQIDDDSDYWYEKLVNEERLFNPYAR